MENIIIPHPPHLHAALEGRTPKGHSIEPIKYNNVFVALGLHEHDPGYEHVTNSFQDLGTCTALHESLWLINAERDLNHVFKRINTHMLDRRIGSNSGFLVLNPHDGRTKWFFSPFISTLIDSNWNIRNNFFVTFNLRDPRGNFKAIYDDLQAVGTSTPLSRSLWYVNSTFSAKEVYQILIGRLEAGDQLCILDSDGHVATWEDRRGQITWLPQINTSNLPVAAQIHLHNPEEELMQKAA